MVTYAQEFQNKSLLRRCKNRVMQYRTNPENTHKYMKSSSSRGKQCFSSSSIDASATCERLFQERPTLAAALLDSWKPNNSSSAPVSPSPSRKLKSPLKVPDGKVIRTQQHSATTKSASVFNLSKKVIVKRFGGFKDARNDFSFSSNNLNQSPLKYASVVNLRNKVNARKNERPRSWQLNKTHSRSYVDIKKLISNFSNTLTHRSVQRNHSDNDNNLRSSVLRSSVKSRMQRADNVDVTTNISMEDLSCVLKKHQAFLLDVDEAELEVVRSCCKVANNKRNNRANALKIKPKPCCNNNPILSKKHEENFNTRKSLKETILNKETRLQFEKYLQNEYSEENLEFWLACDEYRFLSPNLRKETSQRIYDEFLKVSATREINVDNKIRVNTQHRMTNPDAFVFMEAQQAVYQLMEKDSYRRFLDSNHL